MLYIRLNVDFQDDPKIAAVEPLAELLYIRCLAWSKHHQTDGLVPRVVLARIGFDLGDVEPLVEQLLSVQLWEKGDGTDAVMVPPSKWAKYQVTKAEVDALRERNAERARVSRERARARERDGPVAVEPDTDTDTDLNTSRVKSANGSKKRATGLPSGFALTARMTEDAEKRGIPTSTVKAQFRQFCDWHTAKGSSYANWESAWRTWCGNYTRFNPKATPNGKPRILNGAVMDEMASM